MELLEVSYMATKEMSATEAGKSVYLSNTLKHS